MKIYEVSSNCIEIYTDDGSWLISYSTPVAFRGNREIIIANNQPQSVTTGKHIAKAFGAPVKDLLKSGRAIHGEIPEIGVAIKPKITHSVTYYRTKPDTYGNCKVGFCIVNCVTGKSFIGYLRAGDSGNVDDALKLCRLNSCIFHKEVITQVKFRALIKDAVCVGTSNDEIAAMLIGSGVV